MSTSKGADLSNYNAKDKAAALDAVALINQHLKDAYLEINGYLNIKYSLPIAQEIVDNSNLKRIQNDIVRYLIASTADMMSDIIELRYKDAIKYLDKVANGKISLSTKATAEQKTTASVGFKTGKKVSLDGY